jgi:hypothetical protein
MQIADNLVVIGSLTTTVGSAAGSASGIVAGTTRTQAGATVLTKQVNRVDTSTAPAAGTTLGDGVLLLAATAGGETIVINNTNNLIQAYGAGTDTINGIAGATGIPLPPGDVAIFECAVAGDWRVDAGVGASGALPTMLSADGITAAGTTQGTAVALPADLNRVISVPSGTGVILPAAKKGIDLFILNHGGLSMQVYGNGTDTIDDVAGATGVSQMNRSDVIFNCFGDGAWYTSGLATGYSITGLQTVQFLDAVTAAGTTQATATPLTGSINTVSTVASGTGVNLPASYGGLAITVINSGANALLVYPAQGAADTINGLAATNGVSLFPGTAATFNCTSPTGGAWTVQPGSTNSAAFNTNVSTASTTLTAANVTGGVSSVDLALTGTLGGVANATMPTVAAMVAALHAPTVGTSYRLRIINESGGAFAWTVLTNTGWTLTGTMTINQNTWREFTVKLTTLTTAVLQNVATGTFT